MNGLLPVAIEVVGERTGEVCLRAGGKRSYNFRSGGAAQR